MIHPISRPLCEYEYKTGKGVTCGTPLKLKIYEFSMKKYGKGMCWAHQTIEKLKAGELWNQIKKE